MLEDEWKRFIEIEHKEVKENIDGLKTEMSEITTVLLGPLPNRSNGVNGRLKKLEEVVEKAIEWGKNVWNVQRPKECLGIKAVKDLEKKIAQDRKTEKDMNVAKINLKGVYFTGALLFLGQIINAILTSGLINIVKRGKP